MEKRGYSCLIKTANSPPPTEATRVDTADLKWTLVQKNYYITDSNNTLTQLWCHHHHHHTFSTTLNYRFAVLQWTCAMWPESLQTRPIHHVRLEYTTREFDENE